MRKFVPDSFIDSTADAISGDGGFRNFFRNYNTETLHAALIISVNKRNFGRTNSLPFLVGIFNTPA